MIKVRVQLGTSRVALGGFGIAKYQMALLGKTAHDVEKARVAAGVGSDDSAMRPLSLRWAQFKRKTGREPVRNLKFTGQMLANRTVRSADERKVRIDNTTRLSRAKARGNEQRTPWLGLSPRNVKKVVERAQQFHGDNVKGISARLKTGGNGRKNFYTSI